MSAICQKGPLEPKTYPSKASETQVRFLRCALSTRGPCMWKYAKNRFFWAKNALFRTILYYQGLCVGGKGVFFSLNNPRAPLASIPIHFWPIGDIFFWRSLKSSFWQKTPSMKVLILGTSLGACPAKQYKSYIRKITYHTNGINVDSRRWGIIFY